MKICIFTENHYKGGVDTFIIDLLRNWPNPEDQLVLRCNSSHPGLAMIETALNSRIIVSTYFRIFSSRTAHRQSAIGKQIIFRKATSGIFRIIQYPLLFPWYILTLYIYFKRSKFATLLVINGGYPGSLLCRCAVIAWSLTGKRNKAISNIHNLSFKPKMTAKVENLIDFIFVQSSSQIIGVSKAVVESLRTRKYFARAKNIKYILNGVNDPFSNSYDFTNYSENKKYDSKTCVMLATFHPYKGHYHALCAFKKVLEDIPDARFEIYGYGSAEERSVIENQIFQLNLQHSVFLNGFSENKREIFQRAAVLLVPSQAYESFGLTVVEAMSYGVPIITTDIGGLPEVMDGSGAGYVTSHESQTEFADKIIEILSSPDLAKRFGLQGRRTFIARYKAERMSQAYYDVVKEIETEGLNK